METTDERRIEGMIEIEMAAKYSHVEIDPLLDQIKNKLDSFCGDPFAKDFLIGQIVLFIGRI